MKSSNRVHIYIYIYDLIQKKKKKETCTHIDMSYKFQDSAFSRFHLLPRTDIGRKYDDDHVRLTWSSLTEFFRELRHALGRSAQVVFLRAWKYHNINYAAWQIHYGKYGSQQTWRWRRESLHVVIYCILNTTRLPWCNRFLESKRIGTHFQQSVLNYNTYTKN